MRLEEWYILLGQYIEVALSRAANQYDWWGTVAVALDEERRGRIKRFDQVRLR